MTDTQTEQTEVSTGGRRNRMDAARDRHSRRLIKAGTEQHGAMAKVQDECKHLAVIIEDKCDEGVAKEAAKKALMEVQFWATHAITHR